MSDYTGRHRPPTRAERRAMERRSRLPKSFSPAYALPTAAAVTLALTAAGATAAQSSPFSVESTSQAAAFTAPGGDSGQAGAAALLDDPELAESARAEVVTADRDSSGLAERRQEASTSVAADQGRDQERKRVARDQARKELAAKKAAQEKAEKQEAEKKKAAEQKRSEQEQSGADGEDSSTSGSGNPSGAAWVGPVDGATFTSGFGPRWGRMHNGVDYSVPVGTPLKAMGEGTVVGAGPMSGYGIYIDIEYSDGTVSRYGHLNSVAASVGQQVSAGDVVAESGNTGQSTGPHLHLEIHPGGATPVDPSGWLAERGIG